MAQPRLSNKRTGAVETLRSGRTHRGREQGKQEEYERVTRAIQERYERATRMHFLSTWLTSRYILPIGCVAPKQPYVGLRLAALTAVRYPYRCDFSRYCWRTRPYHGPGTGFHAICRFTPGCLTRLISFLLR